MPGCSTYWSWGENPVVLRNLLKDSCNSFGARGVAMTSSMSRKPAAVIFKGSLLSLVDCLE